MASPDVGGHFAGLSRLAEASISEEPGAENCPPGSVRGRSGRWPSYHDGLLQMGTSDNSIGRELERKQCDVLSLETTIRRMRSGVLFMWCRMFKRVSIVTCAPYQRF
jgi:hypothetical protein